MTNEELIGLLQKDLENERMHCLFYQQAAATVKGIHREELRELFLKEAQSELVHIDEFATLIVQLGGIPATSVAAMPECMLPTPDNLCFNAHIIESAVASNYAKRLAQTEQSEGEVHTETSYVHLFYEDQLIDSQKSAFEFKLMSLSYQRIS